MTDKPHRVQLSRAKGWRMPPNTVSVARPARWGNPFYASKCRPEDVCLALFRNAMQGVWDPKVSVHLPNAWCGYSEHVGFLRKINGFPAHAAAHELRGKNLACWCAIDTECHADVLLELANGP